MDQALDRFEQDRAARDQQQDRVQQRGKDRCVAQAVGQTRRRRAPRQHGCYPRHQQPQHVGQVVSGVGEQRCGVRHEAVAGLDEDKRRIHGNADREGAAEIHGVTMASMTMSAMIAFVARMIVTAVVVMTVAVIHASSLQRFRAKWIPVRVKKTRQNKSWSAALIPSKPEQLAPAVLATAVKHSSRGDIL